MTMLETSRKGRPKGRTGSPQAQEQRPRVRPHWLDLPVLAGVLLVPVLLALIGAAGLSIVSWLRGPMDADDAATLAPLRPAPIDGKRAYAYLKKICDLGPRPAGSEANRKQRNLVAKHFQAHGGTVRQQPFTARHPLTGAPVRMSNLVGSWFPERTHRVLITAHYDTRPFPDEEFDPARRRLPFIGANDGASGVALMMEIAHHLDDMDTPYGVDLVLLDGEELVYGRRGEYFLGSKVFAHAYAKARKSGRLKTRYVAGILLDMVGGRDMTIRREPYSLQLAPEIMRDVWAVADRLGAKSFSDEVGQAVLDDHLALNDGGIPTIDLIDFTYPFWHKADDVPENCSPASLAEVGRVVTAWLSLPDEGRRDSR